MRGIEYRDATPSEVAAAEAETAGVAPEVLCRITFSGHLVHNPMQAGTLAPMFSGHILEVHPGIPGQLHDVMLAELLRRFLAALEARA